MSQSPDVSVVIPIFNHVHGLDGLLDALAAQTLDPDRFEVTIVDNYSTDGTWDALVARAAEGSLRFRLLRTSFNGGGPATPRNLGSDGAGQLGTAASSSCTARCAWSIATSV